MEDVRQVAQERASRPKKAPVGASFESERQRSKNALVKQIASQDGRNVRMIAAATERPEEERILRVAAYCRVSTDDIDQALSIHLQIQQYMKKIKENPNWKYAGCYVDDGFSGTNTDHRQGFQKLMLNILREENGCDLTYFIEYYLELLSRAVEERRLRQMQKEERSRQAELALARTPLMATAVPTLDPTPPDSGRPAPPGPETAEASGVPTETDPNYPERGGENKDWLSANSWAGNETEMDSETSIARVRDELHHLASNSGPVMKTGAKFLLSLMDKQTYTFTVDDIVHGCGFALKQAGNFVTHLREMSLIESVGKRTNRCMIYQFATSQLPLELPGLFPGDHAGHCGAPQLGQIG